MRSPISIVDVDRPDTWTRYRAGLCESCAANCCTMPLEVQLSDLVRLGLVDAFEAEHGEARHIAKRLQKARLIDHFNHKNVVFTLPRGVARCTSSGLTPVGCTPKRRAPSQAIAPTDGARPDALCAPQNTLDTPSTAQRCHRIEPMTAKALPTIDLARCTGCGWCVAVCPPHVLSLEVQGSAVWGPKRAQLDDPATCTGCALCAVRCPFGVIRMVRSAATTCTKAL